MKKEIIDNMKKAYTTCNLRDDGNLSVQILEYIASRIEINRDEIEKIISIYQVNASVDEILKVMNDRANINRESTGKTIITEQGFMFAQVLVPVGTIVVRAYEPLEIIKYWVYAIETKNAIAVASDNYNDMSVEALIYIIMKEALKKFSLDENQIMYIKESECQYELFDKVIYTCNKDGKIYDKPEVEDIAKLSIDEKMYVYLENDDFKLEAEQNQNAQILKGNIDEIIEKIGYARAATIYTKDSKSAYKFINFVNADNVFVNTNLKNVFEIINSDNELYKYKNIIIPVPKEMIKREQESDKSIANAVEINTQHEEKQLVKYKQGLWEKIRNIFKELF